MLLQAQWTQWQAQDRFHDPELTQHGNLVEVLLKKDVEVNHVWCAGVVYWPVSVYGQCILPTAAVKC